MTRLEKGQIVSRDPEVAGGGLVFSGTRVPEKRLVDYLEAGHSPDDFPSVSRDQSTAHLRMTLESAGRDARSA